MNELFDIMRHQPPGGPRWALGSDIYSNVTQNQHFYVVVPVTALFNMLFGRLVPVCRWHVGAPYIGPPVLKSSNSDPHCFMCMEIQLQYGLSLWE